MDTEHYKLKCRNLEKKAGDFRVQICHKTCCFTCSLFWFYLWSVV